MYENCVPKTTKMKPWIVLVLTGFALVETTAKEDPPCTHATKQTALYLNYVWSKNEDPRILPATSVSVEHRWTNTSDLERFGKNGIFAAHPIEIGEDAAKIGGYFGSQADGSPGAGGLLFSIWDSIRQDQRFRTNTPNATWSQHRHAFPLSPSCQRHCLDCGLHPGWHNTTGVQCSVPMHVRSNDTIVFNLTRIATNQTLINPLGMELHYVGDIWELIATNKTSMKVTNVGKMFLEDVHVGLTRFGAFHEHIGCVPCDSFYESETRVGPFAIQPGNRTVQSISFQRDKNVSCQLFDVKTLNDMYPPEALISTGPGT